MKMSEVIAEKRQGGKDTFGKMIATSIILGILIYMFYTRQMMVGTGMTILGLVLCALNGFANYTEGWGTDEELLGIYAREFCRKDHKKFESEAFDDALKKDKDFITTVLSMEDYAFKSRIRHHYTQ